MKFKFNRGCYLAKKTTLKGASRALDQIITILHTCIPCGSKDFIKFLFEHFSFTKRPVINRNACSCFSYQLWDSCSLIWTIWGNVYSFSQHTYSINMKNETNDKLLLVLHNTTGKQASSTSKLSSQISKLKYLMKLTLTREVCVLLKHRTENRLDGTGKMCGM